MQTHPDTDFRPWGPGLRTEPLLGSDSGLDRYVGSGERHTKPVATSSEHKPVVLGERFLQDFVVTSQRVLHRRSVVLPKLSRTLDIGEQKCHRSCRPLSHGSQHLTPPDNNAENDPKSSPKPIR
jgi:hypothetical protein